jgi:D-serine deaminase-like pyridoxal phosphate-dependent protein
VQITEWDTPAAMVDLDILEANIARLQKYLDEHGVRNRPHVKTHKIPEIAHMQIRAGAVGITCQKISEAEVMAQGGIQDIFLPYNIVGAAKLERLTHLASRVRLSMTADSEFTVRGLSAAAHARGLELPVLVEFDTGGCRCGVQTPEEAFNLANLIAHSPGLRFGGLMTFPLNDNTDPFVTRAKELLGRVDIPIDIVSAGSSAQMYNVHRHPVVNEHRAGQYVYGDRRTVKSGTMSLDDCSFKIIATVVSRPTATRGILDAGSKSLSSDIGQSLEGHGQILEYPDACIYTLSEEHGHVDFSKCAKKPEIGERVTIIANHCCPANNLFNEIVAVRKNEVQVVWPVAARGTVK